MINHNRWICDLPLKFHAASPDGISLTHGVLLVLLLLRLGAPPVTAQSTRGSPSAYPYAPDAEFNFTLTIIIVVLVGAFFSVGFFSILIRQCTDIGNLPDSQPSASVNNRSRPPARGLDSSFINSFPIFLYSSVKEHKIGKGALECAVCITEFEDSDTLRLLPKCDHVFHPDCIDAWLAFHSTCPVCRSNLTPEELAGEKENRAESIHPSNGRNSRSEESEIQNRVLIDVEEDLRREQRAVRVGAPNKFPRSHSTGHSLVQPGEYCERYTLRLPEGVRKQIVTLSRTTSCVVVLPTEESSRMGYKSGSEDGNSRGRSNQDRFFLRSDRVGRWGLSITPLLLTRTGSSRSPKVGFDGDLTVGSSKMFLNSVKTPFGCLAGGKDDMVEQSTNRPPV